MRRTIFLLAITLTQFLGAQTFTVEMPNNAIEKFQKLLTQSEDISFENFKFITENSNQKYAYKIVATQYTNGIIANQFILFETNHDSNLGRFENNQLNFSILGKPINNEEYKTSFNINDNLYINQTFQLDDSEKFSIKHFFNQKMTFNKGTNTLLFALVKPIKINENMYRNCDYGTAKDDAANWFTTFGINDYVTLEIIFY